MLLTCYTQTYNNWLACIVLYLKNVTHLGSVGDRSIKVEQCVRAETDSAYCGVVQWAILMGLGKRRFIR